MEKLGLFARVEERKEEDRFFLGFMKRREWLLAQYTLDYVGLKKVPLMNDVEV